MRWKPKLKRMWRNWIKPLAIVLLVSATFRSAVADWNDVPTGSMKPSILVGDRIFVNKLAYDLKIPFTMQRVASWDDPRRGDVVVFFSPENGQRLVKRVVGLPGDTIVLRQNKLVVNGKAAAYAPLSQRIREQVNVWVRTNSRFAAEQIAAQGHPVMLTPGRLAMSNYGPASVPAGHYFFLGDNRDNSRDSRYFGCVDRSLIVGKATAVILSLDYTDHLLPRWKRFFTSMP
jgi:signal peptidase I